MQFLFLKRKDGFTKYSKLRDVIYWRPPLAATIEFLNAAMKVFVSNIAWFLANSRSVGISLFRDQNNFIFAYWSFRNIYLFSKNGFFEIYFRLLSYDLLSTCRIEEKIVFPKSKTNRLKFQDWLAMDSILLEPLFL